jgi:hypothetical protein
MDRYVGKGLIILTIELTFISLNWFSVWNSLWSNTDTSFIAFINCAPVFLVVDNVARFRGFAILCLLADQIHPSKYALRWIKQKGTRNLACFEENFSGTQERNQGRK